MRQVAAEQRNADRLETDCKEENKQDFVVESVWAIYKCSDGSERCVGGDTNNDPSTRVSDSPESENKFDERIILGTVAQSGEPSKSGDSDRYKTKDNGDKVKMKFEEVYPNMVGAALVYEVGIQERGKVTEVCEEGDFYATNGKTSDDKKYNKGDKVPDSGSLTASDVGFILDNDGCRSYNTNFIGDGRPMLTCTRGELVRGDSGNSLLSHFFFGL